MMCPLIGEDRKWRFGAVRTVFDPLQTLQRPWPMSDTTQSGKGNEERGTGLAPQYPSCFSSALSCHSSPGPVCDSLWGGEGT
jgi:hypothetical protein